MAVPVPGRLMRMCAAGGGVGARSDREDRVVATSLSFILGMKIPDAPYQLDKWRREHPGQDIPDGHVFTQPWPAGPSSSRRDQVIYYQFRADRARRTLRGIDEQVAKHTQDACCSACAA